MVADFFHYALITLAIVTAIAAIEIKDLIRAVISFCIMNVFFALIFFVLGAPLVAVFQLAVYAGAVTVLFLAAIHTIRGETA